MRRWRASGSMPVMRAITFESPLHVSVTTVADPDIVAPGDAIVRVERTAICGSDLHVYHGRETGLDAGTILGHEFLGEVVARGRDTRLPIGARVVSPFTTSCGACFFCREGLTARCDRGQLFGWVAKGRGLHGAQSELVRVPLADSTLVRVPVEVDGDAALFVGDILATGWHCAEGGVVGPGKVVCVVGCGPVGLMAIVAARALGPARLFAVDGMQDRLDLAAGFGAEPIAPGVDPLLPIREATDGRGADVVLEAVGSQAALRRAIDLVRFGGVVSSVGVQTEQAFAFTPIEAYDKNLILRFGRCPARAYAERLLGWLAVTQPDLRRIVSHRLPLAAGVAAYDTFARRIDGCTKVVLTP